MTPLFITIEILEIFAEAQAPAYALVREGEGNLRAWYLDTKASDNANRYKNRVCTETADERAARLRTRAEDYARLSQSPEWIAKHRKQARESQARRKRAMTYVS